MSSETRRASTSSAEGARCRLGQALVQSGDPDDAHDVEIEQQRAGNGRDDDGRGADAVGTVLDQGPAPPVIQAVTMEYGDDQAEQEQQQDEPAEPTDRPASGEVAEGVAIGVRAQVLDVVEAGQASLLEHGQLP